MAPPERAVIREGDVLPSPGQQVGGHLTRNSHMTTMTLALAAHRGAGHHSGPSGEVLPSEQQNFPGMLGVVDRHGEVRTQVEGEERPVPAGAERRPSDGPGTQAAPPSPVAQPAEEQVRRKVPPQPGQAAQQRQPGQAGQPPRARPSSLCPRPPDPHTAPDHHRREDGKEEPRRPGGQEGQEGSRTEEGVQRGDEASQHGGVKAQAGDQLFYHAWRPWGGRRSGMRVFISVSQP